MHKKFKFLLKNLAIKTPFHFLYENKFLSVKTQKNVLISQIK